MDGFIHSLDVGCFSIFYLVGGKIEGRGGDNSIVSQPPKTRERAGRAETSVNLSALQACCVRGIVQLELVRAISAAAHSEQAKAKAVRTYTDSQSVGT